MNLQEATMRALQGKLEETKGTDKLFTCIEDRQGGTWAVGRTMTAEEWGNTASSWAEQDNWEDPEEPLLKNFSTEQDCIDFIQEIWEITIVPSDDPEAKAFLDEGWFNKKLKDKKEPTTTADDHPELAELIKARNMTRVGKDGWEMPQDDKEIKNEDNRPYAQSKKTENKDGVRVLDTQAYWAYVLGYDLLHDKLKQDGPACDETFIEAWKIADDFMKSEEFKNTNKSGYDALVDYLKNHNLI